MCDYIINTYNNIRILFMYSYMTTYLLINIFEYFYYGHNFKLLCVTKLMLLIKRYNIDTNRTPDANTINEIASGLVRGCYHGLKNRF